MPNRARRIIRFDDLIVREVRARSDSVILPRNKLFTEIESLTLPAHKDYVILRRMLSGSTSPNPENSPYIRWRKAPCSMQLTRATYARNVVSTTV